MTATIAQPDNPIRKAAVLVRSLDSESVAALLARLSPAEAKAVRQAVRELDEVSEDDRRQVAAALRGDGITAAAEPVTPDAQPSDSAVVAELSADLPEAYGPPTTYAAPAPTPADAGPLHRFSQADPEALTAYLRHEQPATIAVVLSCLPPDRAAEALSRLPEDLQESAVDRLAAMGDIDPDSLDVIAAELEAWIAQHTQEAKRRQDRLTSLRAILTASPADARGRLADKLSKRWPELQAELRSRPDAPAPKPASEPAPEQRELISLPPRPARPEPRPEPQVTPIALDALNGRQLTEALAQVDRGMAMVALFGASEEVIRRLSVTLSGKQMRLLKQELRRLGPVRLSDITHAQQAVGRAAALALGNGRAA